MSSTQRVRPVLSSSDGVGVGIVEFLEGKNYLITGSTGFVAKVLIEKMLRTVPNLGKVFLLIREKDKRAATDRLKSEIIDSELFKCLKEIYGKSYQGFMMSKLVPVLGNVCEKNLGMDADTASELAEELDVIINSAANTSWDQRYDIAIDINTKGPARLLKFAKKCRKLKIFLHVSTAYVNGERCGKILEKPFCMGQSMVGEDIINSRAPSVAVNYPFLDVIVEMELPFRVLKSVHNNREQARKMKDLGMERARTYGWQNTYELTKAMGEMLINSMRGDLPVVIIRPSMVESTYKEPFPGWIQGTRVTDPLHLSYGQGRLPGFVGDPTTIIDIIPVDMVVNLAIAALAKHGVAVKPELHVYQIGSSVANPLSLHDMFEFSHNHFTSSPLLDLNGKEIVIEQMKLFESLENFTSYIREETVRKCGLMDKEMVWLRNLYPQLYLWIKEECNKRMDRAIHMAKIYEPYMFYKGRFAIDNSIELMKDVSDEEKMKFGFDVGCINWKHYFESIHLSAVRRLIKKEQLPAGKSFPYAKI